MAIHIDNQVFVERKLSQIEQFKQAHPNVPFKYNKLISFLLISSIRARIDLLEAGSFPWLLFFLIF